MREETWARAAKILSMERNIPSLVGRWRVAVLHGRKKIECKLIPTATTAHRPTMVSAPHQYKPARDTDDEDEGEGEAPPAR